jgi:ketosteroid isomerase-like protein
MAKRIDPKTIALQFNDCINNKDLEGLLNLMTDDHTFIDSANNHFNGKPTCKIAWTGFFAAFPDYKNVFEIVSSKDATAIMQGYSVCSDKSLEGRGIWTAKIVNDKIIEWRIYLDTAENKTLLGLMNNKKTRTDDKLY